MNLQEMALDEFPIKFHRVSPGEYLSLDAFPPWAHTWRIHRTEHTGRGSANRGRTRWHITYLPTGLSFGTRYTDHNGSLNDAVRTLHLTIGRALRDGFEVLAKMNVEAELKIAAAAARAEVRAKLESKIRKAILDGMMNGEWSDLSDNDIKAMAVAITDAVQAP